MTARTRSSPRVSRSPKKSGRESWLTRLRRSSLNRPEVIGVAVALVPIAVLPFIVDLGALGSGARDWFARTFGLGLFIIMLLSALGGLAISQRRYENPGFWRKAFGTLAFSYFAWGLLGMNHAEWTLGGVNFKDETLGGDIGDAIVAGPLGLLAWLSTFLVGMALLAPGFTAAFARNAPKGLQYTWSHRWPHRFAGSIWTILSSLFARSPREEDEPVIDFATVQHARAVPMRSHETTPVLIRPTIDPASPGSTIGAGAAVAFRNEPVVPAPVAMAPEHPAPAPVIVPEPAISSQASFLEDEEDDPEVDYRKLSGKPSWELPEIEMLTPPQISASRKFDNAARGQLIVDTLASFGVDATVIEINEGPTVTQFGVEPGWEIKYREEALKDENGKALIGPDGRPRKERIETGRTKVRVNKITALQNDLALALAAPTLRIEAPVPGRSIVGIEVPNDSASVVTMRGVMETKEFGELQKKAKLAIALGKGVSGQAVVADLAKMPHLLIAGATGSGKSVCVNSIIAGIMMNATPDEAKFVMVDPKRVELTQYSGMPHMAFSEVIVDMDKVVGTLQAVIAEMDARYKKFAALGVRNIEGYNKHPRILKKLPYWVVIIDELADLMMVAPFEVEKLICRLAQLARATGIHLVVATQRPSVDVVTGLIKANFPTRIAFAVTSMTDSRTILDTGGAEKLLGRGDMLYMPTDASKPIRIQGVYLSDAEIERLIAFWNDDRFKYLERETSDDLLAEALIAQNGGDEDIDVDEDDPVYDAAIELALQHQRVSPSLFQRRLNVGYLKAAKLIEMLEDDGLVGPREEGESRPVIAPSGFRDDD